MRSRMSWEAVIFVMVILVLTLASIIGVRADPVYIDRCSATYIGGGYVLTAGHCVGTDIDHVIKVDKESEGGWSAKVILTDHYHDIAVLKLDKVLVQKEDTWIPGTVEYDYKTLPFKASKVGCDWPKLFDTYYMKGWPAGLYAETRGMIGGEKAKRFHWPVSYLIFIQGAPGSSGSGLYSEGGVVVGVMTGWIPGSGIMIFVPTAEVCGIIPSEAK